jgi:serine protease Do
MKQVIMKRLLIAGIAVLTVPSALLAQKEKEVKDKKEKKEAQQIIITRTGDKDEKMVIEIEGDKVKVNGKDVKDQKEAGVNVHVNTIHTPGTNFYRYNPSVAQGRTAWTADDEFVSLFNEDENRAMLGVTTEGCDKGAQIKSITKESAAEKAGLKKGDILTKIGSKKIESTDDVTEAIHAQKPGDKISISYLRDGKEQSITAELGKWKGIRMNAVNMPRIADMEWNELAPSVREPMVFGQNGFYFGGRPRLGLSIQDTDDGVGVKVLEVDEESAAAKAGIKEGDIIVGVDDHEVKGTEDVTKTVRENKEKTSFNFKVKRDGKNQNIEVKFPKKLKTADL